MKEDIGLSWLTSQKRLLKLLRIDLCTDLQIIPSSLMHTLNDITY